MSKHKSIDYKISALNYYLDSEKIYKKRFLSNDLVQRLKQDIPEYF